MRQTYEFKCMKCKKVYEIKAGPVDMESWRMGTHIQRAMPYLTADERELMISRVCGPCYDKMFE